MNQETLTLKKILRKEMILRRRQVSEKRIKETSNTIVPRVLDFIEQRFSSSQDFPLTIMSYMSYGKEFPTIDLNRAILEKGWRLVLPYTDCNFNIIACVTDNLEGLQRSQMGIEEPNPSISLHITADEADLILLPGIAFDRCGKRLGYGKGCYDRFLSSSINNGNIPLTAGLSWSFQVIENVPSEDHDQTCDFLFTEKEIIFTSSDHPENG